VKTLDAQSLGGSLTESKATVIAPDQGIAAAVGESRVGHELWLPLAVAALVLLVAEGLLAYWYTRRTGEPNGVGTFFSRFLKAR